MENTAQNSKTFSSKEMLKQTCPPGYWWENIAKLGSKPRWKMVKDPNHDKHAAGICTECGSPSRNGRRGCDCDA